MTANLNIFREDRKVFSFVFINFAIVHVNSIYSCIRVWIHVDLKAINLAFNISHQSNSQCVVTVVRACVLEVLSVF
jgi:hypothetical protein